MKKNYQMSYFQAPVSTFRDANGNLVHASLIPECSVSLSQIHRLITTDSRLADLTRRVRASPDRSAAKQRLLPFVTPCGTFSRRNSHSLQQLSGLMPIDIDKLPSASQAEELRHRLAADPYLRPALTFVSPSGQGVKLFVPYQLERVEQGNVSLSQLFQWASTYVEVMYGVPVDGSGKDVVRACFLFHDPQAQMRNF